MEAENFVKTARAIKIGLRGWNTEYLAGGNIRENIYPELRQKNINIKILGDHFWHLIK